MEQKRTGLSGMGTKPFSFCSTTRIVKVPYYCWTCVTGSRRKLKARISLLNQAKAENMGEQVT